jgi:hypothetical protein
MAVPLSTNLDWKLANSKWASTLNPFIANPVNNAQIIQDVTLQSGSNILNHSLGRTLQGWFIVDIQGVASIYRSAPFNSQTLTLTSSAKVTCSIGVF